MGKIYLCIDLKSFYASVECVERGLDPLTANLVVADKERTEKTICLAVTPSLKSYGISGRARLFEVVSKVDELNRIRKYNCKEFKGESYDYNELKENKNLKITYLIAPPRMAYYMDYSTKIYKIYLKYVAPEDIHVYSIDEVFMDVTNYLKRERVTAHEFAMKIVKDVVKETGITATAGIGTNMYLAKVAMDIVAKHVDADKDGVRIAELTEKTYREKLWAHTPITDFWRVGKGYAKRLSKVGLYTMGDIARCSLGKEKDFYNEDLLYDIFGVNAELLIDHAWGYEPCTIEDIRKYKPETKSIGKGQVLSTSYSAEKSKLVVREMTELLVLELVEKRLVTSQIVLTIGYDRDNLLIDEVKNEYKGEVVLDPYGRKLPKPSQGRINLDRYTSSLKLIMKAVTELFDRISNPALRVRRLNISMENVIYEEDAEKIKKDEQLNFFTDYEKEEEKEEKLEKELKKERNIQETIIKIKEKYGKSAVLKGMNLEEGATTIERNNKIGGHRA